jgi:hypothetical protein
MRFWREDATSNKRPRNKNETKNLHDEEDDSDSSSFFQQSGWKTIGLRIIAKATTKIFTKPFLVGYGHRTTLAAFQGGQQHNNSDRSLFLHGVVPSRPTLDSTLNFGPDLNSHAATTLDWTCTVTPHPKSIAPDLERFLASSWNEERLYRCLFGCHIAEVVLPGPALPFIVRVDCSSMDHSRNRNDR